MAKPADKTILIIDDEDDIREYFADVLRDAGFQVMTACDGNEALDMVQKKVPDFISLDLVMKGKSGIKFLYELRRNKAWNKIPYVIVTAHASDELGREDLTQILANKTFLGPGVYLEKPVSPEQYLDFFCAQLGVEAKTEPGPEEVSALQAELEQRMQNADASTLKSILNMLKK